MTDKLKVNFSTEKTVTEQDLLNEVAVIQRAYKAQKMHKRNDEKRHIFLDEQTKMHEDFAKRYPIVIKYLCLFGQFNAKAFIKHVKKLNEKLMPKEEEYLEYQAIYVTDLYKAEHPKITQKEYLTCKQNVLVMLQKEANNIKELVEQAKKEVEEQFRIYAAMDRSDLKHLIEELHAKKDQLSDEERAKLFTCEAIVRLRNDEEEKVVLRQDADMSNLVQLKKIDVDPDICAFPMFD